MAENFSAVAEFEPPATAEAKPLSVAAEFDPPEQAVDVFAEFEPPPKQQRAAIIEDAQAKITDWNDAFRRADSPTAALGLVRKWAGEKAADAFKQNADEFLNTPIIPSLPRLNVPSMEDTPESMRPMQKPASVLAGAYNAAAGFTESMATPFNVATLGTFGALAKAAQSGGRAAKAAEAALAALKVSFGAWMAHEAGGQAGKASVELFDESKSLQEKTETALAPLLTGGLAILSAHSGAKDAATILERAPARGGQPETVLPTPEPPPKPPSVIEQVSRMSPEEFLKWEKENGGQTGASNKVGIELIDNPEGIAELKKAGELAKAEWRAAFEEAKAAGPGANAAVENKMQVLASKEQFFNEAVSAAEGTGSGLQDPAVVAAHAARRKVSSEFTPPDGLNPDAPVVGLGAASPAEFRPVSEFATAGIVRGRAC